MEKQSQRRMAGSLPISGQQRAAILPQCESRFKASLRLLKLRSHVLDNLIHESAMREKVLDNVEYECKKPMQRLCDSLQAQHIALRKCIVDLKNWT